MLANSGRQVRDEQVRDVLEASELSGEKLRRLPIRESYKPPIGTVNTRLALVGKGFDLDRSKHF
ncbi:hypothetical protein A2U01_0010174 [Trifolium medium]|uniref:Uncharacterized protein n=1 Tax=Trifolium medium TaxID=97028 RepID=A0A392MP46_9FABA|nr:hypothetical protein [Trifolium medium]